MIAIRAAVLSGLVLMVVPGFGSGPKSEELEFYFTRLAYTDIYGRGPGGLADFRGFRRGAWTTGAWDADNKYMWRIQRMTNVNLSRDPHPLAITDPDLFKYP